MGIAIVLRMDGWLNLFGIGIGASRKIRRTIYFAVRDYFIFDFAYTGCVAASDACARNYFCITYYFEHFGLFGVCAGRCFERDISSAESIVASQKTGRNVLEISGAGCFGTDEPERGAGGNSGLGCGNRVGIYLGESIARTLLEWRSERNYFAADAGLLRDVFISFAADGLARRASGDVLHVQFCVGAI